MMGALALWMESQLCLERKRKPPRPGGRNTEIGTSRCHLRVASEAAKIEVSSPRSFLCSVVAKQRRAIASLRSRLTLPTGALLRWKCSVS
eukprot:s2742_g8.t1